MRYKITLRSQRPPYHFVLRLGNGQLLRDTLQNVHRKVNVGETGTLVNVQTSRGVLTRLVPDAIDIEWTNVDK